MNQVLRLAFQDVSSRGTGAPTTRSVRGGVGERDKTTLP
jgi:hypothetical protein